MWYLGRYIVAVTISWRTTAHKRYFEDSLWHIRLLTTRIVCLFVIRLAQDGSFSTLLARKIPYVLIILYITSEKYNASFFHRTKRKMFLRFTRISWNAYAMYMYKFSTRVTVTSTFIYQNLYWNITFQNFSFFLEKGRGVLIPLYLFWQNCTNSKEMCTFKARWVKHSDEHCIKFVGSARVSVHVHLIPSTDPFRYPTIISCGFISSRVCPTPTQSFHWASHDFMMILLPIITLILTAPRYTHLTNDVHLGLIVGKFLPFKCERMYKQTDTSIHIWCRYSLGKAV